MFVLSSVNVVFVSISSPQIADLLGSNSNDDEDNSDDDESEDSEHSDRSNNRSDSFDADSSFGE